jgi:hypothetical protein
MTILKEMVITCLTGTIIELKEEMIMPSLEITTITTALNAGILSTDRMISSEIMTTETWIEGEVLTGIIISLPMITGRTEGILKDLHSRSQIHLSPIKENKGVTCFKGETMTSRFKTAEK